ncbi:WbqC family protein [Vibrio sp. 10N.286.51.B11]|uniref:WbqC family protein n=1 Tax=Vibrio sp. 10N.286.51.B11 TaxID=3229706 RepID=UPI00354D6278
MKLGIMQPYFLPYLGYFQLINEVDKFVVYDNIQFTKTGWINRNRILVNGKEMVFSINLTKDSSYLNVCDRTISPVYKVERKKILRKIESGYRNADFYKEVMPLLTDIIECDMDNLFDYILNSIVKINEYLNINTPIVISSSLTVSHELKGEDRVIETCKQSNCNEYVNPIGGIELYSKENFQNNKLSLSFIEMGSIIYPQGKEGFVSHLSIIDVLMWNSREDVCRLLTNYELI